VFERFTGTAKRSIVRSEQEAISLGHDYIGTEHLLLGLAGVPEGLAAEVLAQSGITVGRMREEVTRLPGRPGAAATRPAEDIDTQHMLLGLLADDEAGDRNRALVTLRALGADPAHLRSRLLDRAAPAG
jgi:ATP-dependent Clp protease ATP-binding subunit ClpA